MLRVAHQRRPRRCGPWLLAAILVPISPCGCRSAPDAAAAPRLTTQLELIADASAVTVGDEVRVTVRSSAGLPEAPEVHWIASGGELVAADAGRSARIRFDQPGEYRVSATLFDDDRIVDTHTVRISVRPAR